MEVSIVDFSLFRSVDSLLGAPCAPIGAHNLLIYGAHGAPYGCQGVLEGLGVLCEYKPFFLAIM